MTHRYLLGEYPARHIKKLCNEEGDAITYPVFAHNDAIKLEGALAELLEGDTTLLLLGPRGTGKTQAAVSIAHQLDQLQGMRGHAGDHYYTQLGQLFEDEKNSWKEGKKVDSMNRAIQRPLERARESQTLVIDELQECTNSDWERQALTRLIDSRYQNEMNTILIGNLTQSALDDFFSKSVTSRLRETGVIIEMTGEKYR